MKTYNIAGIKVNMDAFGKTKEQAVKYLTEYTENPDISIRVSDNLIARYVDLGVGIDESSAYYIASGFAFYRQLLDFEGFMLHSSAVAYNGGAYLFAGPSGIGKSTHTKLWQELLGDKCFILNDDKPAIRYVDNEIYAYGTPWSGKNNINENIRVAVKGLCFVSRSNNNRIERLSKKDAAINIISQCTKNFTESQWNLLFSVIDRIVDKVAVYKIFCNKDISAAKLSFSTMTGGQNEN